MGKALYRKYRSKSLDEVVGQDHITSILRRAIDTGRVAHAYLLTGPRGVGKTSIARILAHEINNLPYDEEATNLDIIEIDAASNNGVEDVRDLREKVQVAPVSAKRKVYIIDEVHMLSRQAFNALLKTLEEPPEHVVFILATTDVDKLPSTIISRTQQFGFRSIDEADIISHLGDIAKKESIKINKEALAIIANRGGGSFRDSIGLLDQLSSLKGKDQTISGQDVEMSLGLAPESAVQNLAEAAKNRQASEIANILDGLERTGVQASVVAQQMIQLLAARLVEDPSLAHLIDALLEANTSKHGYTKLLVTLIKSSQPKPKSAALVAPAPFVSAPIAELERKAVQKKPKDTKPTVADTPAPKAATKPEEVAETDIAEEPVPEPAKFVKPAETGEEQPINWEGVVDHARKNYVALFSVLSKCTPSFDGETLTLYTVNAFYKKKLDDTKYSPLVYECLKAAGINDVEIDTIPTPSPPKDSQAAAVAAIMGGGEEVSL